MLHWSVIRDKVILPSAFTEITLKHLTCTFIKLLDSKRSSEGEIQALILDCTKPLLPCLPKNTPFYILGDTVYRCHIQNSSL